MENNERSSDKPGMGRWRFLIGIATTGTGIVGLSVLPMLAPRIAGARDATGGEETTHKQTLQQTEGTTLPRSLRWTSNADFGRTVPIVGKCEMLQVEGLEFAEWRGAACIFIYYRFIDGKMTGDVCFKGQLLSSSDEVLEEAQTIEERNRNLPPQTFHSGRDTGQDGPNRYGKAKFRFKHSLNGVAKVRIEVTPVD